MGVDAWLSSPTGLEADAMLAEINERLTIGGMSIAIEDARMLSDRRAEALADSERVEFGCP